MQYIPLCMIFCQTHRDMYSHFIKVNIFHFLDFAASETLHFVFIFCSVLIQANLVLDHVDLFFITYDSNLSLHSLHEYLNMVPVVSLKFLITDTRG